MKTIDDIDLDKIDFTKHLIKIPANDVWYRVVRKGTDPFLPAGLPNRFVTTPKNFDIIEFQNKFKLGLPTLTCGTASTIVCESVQTAFLESGLAISEADAYKITFLSEIDIVYMDSICEAEGIPKPYMPKDHTPIFQLFYGKKIKGFLYESAKNPEIHNVVFFWDWCPELKNIIKRDIIEIKGTVLII